MTPMLWLLRMIAASTVGYNNGVLRWTSPRPSMFSDYHLTSISVIPLHTLGDDIVASSGW